MRFIKTDSEKKPAEYLQKTIQEHLDKGESVLWLVSGGSAIGPAVECAQKLHNTDRLTAALADERYVASDSRDSNWTQLMKAGFSAEKVRFEPVLRGKSASDTSNGYSKLIEELFLSADYKIGLLGIGADGHIAGILPGSKAAVSANFVQYYDAADFRRITLTPKALLKLDEAVVYAMRSSKERALRALEENLTISAQPAQILKFIPKATIFNDLKEDG